MRTLLAVTLVLGLVTAARGDIFSDTWIRGASSVAVNDDATALFVNPAGLGIVPESGLYGSLSLAGEDPTGISLAWKGGGLGVGYGRQYLWRSCPCEEGFVPSDDGVDTYAVGLAFGEERKWSVGADRRWVVAAFGAEERTETWDVGVMVRPTGFLSVGAALRNGAEPVYPEAAWRAPDGDGRRGAEAASRATYVVGLAFRPIGLGDRLTIMADRSIERDADATDAVYTLGLEAEPVDGVTVRGSFQSLAGGADRDQEVSVGLFVNTTHVGAGASYRTFEPAADDVITYAAYATAERMRTIARATRRVAEIDIEGPLSDSRGGWSLFGTPTRSAQGVIGDIRRAAEDGSVACVLLDIRSVGRGFLGAPPALAQEIRDAVLDARRKRGVRFVAYLGYGASTTDYFLASAADRIVLDPVGVVESPANYVTVMRYTGTSEKLGIEWDYLSAGKYKSTFHSIGPDSLTPEQREEVQSLVDDSYAEIVKAVASGRGLSVAEAEALCDGRLMTPQEALDARLVDEIGVYEDAKAAALALVGRDVPEEREDISLADVRGWREKAYDWNFGPTVAVVGAYGDIVVGEGGHDPLWGDESIGSETLVEVLKRVRKDPSVKAVVFRVDSGGGDPLASDIIWRETVKLAEEKPLIVSMGDVAGSGGYYIAVRGQRIFADPLTITGSIGVAGSKPALAPLYEKIGATHETFRRGVHADAFSTTRRLTDEERTMWQGIVDWFYADFLDKVADGRHMPIERVRELAQGRVYTGNQATGNGLVDELGGLTAAIDYACEQVGVPRDDAKIVYYREGTSWFDHILAEAAGRLRLGRFFDLGSRGVQDLLELRMEVDPLGR